MTAVDLTQGVSEFLQYIGVVKGYSPHTLANYRRDLAKLVNFCSEQDISDAYALDQTVIRRWVAQLSREKLSANSIQRHLSATRSLYKFLARHQ